VSPERITIEITESVLLSQAMQKVGCTHLQGFLFSKPLPADRIEAMVALGRLAAIRNSEPLLPEGSKVASRVITGRRRSGGKAA
jgi:hypothetical protein